MKLTKNRQIISADAGFKFEIVHILLHVHGSVKGLSEIAIVHILCTLDGRVRKIRACKWPANWIWETF